MGAVAALFICKLITLAGSTATTAWAVSFFFFQESLAQHRWTLFLGGFALVAIGEIGSWLIGRRLQGQPPEAP